MQLSVFSKLQVHLKKKKQDEGTADHNEKPLQQLKNKEQYLISLRHDVLSLNMLTLYSCDLARFLSLPKVNIMI